MHKLDGFESLFSQLVVVGKWVVPFGGLENDTAAYVDKHVIMAESLFGRLENFGVLLDLIDDGREMLQFANFVGSRRRSGRVRYVLDELGGKRRGRQFTMVAVVAVVAVLVYHFYMALSDRRTGIVVVEAKAK